MGKILQSTCLKPKYPLRRQLLVTFGSIAFLTIAIAVLLATITAQLAGQIVQDQARESLQDQVLNDIQVTSAYLADVVSRRLANLDGAAMIQYEIVRDRIVGYPDRGWENDTHVPFFDILTQRNVYPIQAPSPQRDWEAEGEFNLAEVPEILRDGVFDTSKAMFRFQGNCDPEKKNPSDKGYYPNCTMANNDVNTGGVVQPVASTQFLAEKAAAIGALQKPIWESHPEILSLNVAFYNSGAGACLCYPSFQVDATETYESEGCEWMLKTNPLTGEPYGSINETRRCHTKGNQVKQREYNPMEHDWCIDQALHPGEVRTAGPFLIHSSWVLAIGRAVFDRITGEFIACTVIYVELSRMSEIFDIASHHDYNEGALVNLDGTVVVSHDTDLWDPLKSTSLVNISDTYFLPPGTFEELTAQWNFDQEWSPDYMDKKVHSNAVLKKSDGVFASLPIPLPPRQYDPLYRPSYYLFLRIDREIFSAIDEVDEAVEDDVEKVVITAILIGVVGLALVALVIWLVARSLTLPLGWMQRVAWRIVNHNDERAGGALDVTKEEEDSRMFVRCTPRTEITDLVSEFRMMIKCFSGEGSSTVAKKNRTEVHNEMRWRSEFFQLYSRLESRTILKNSNGENDEACTDTSTTVTSLSPSIGVDTSVGGSTIAKESAPPISTKTPHTKLNMGRHCISISDQVEEERLKSEIRNDLKRQRTKVRQSRLFWWIVILIVLPLLITFLAIGGVVVHAILNVFPSWLETLESASYDIEVGALLQTASLRASFSRAVMTEPLRDIHIFNRLVSWLLFGVVQVKGVTSMKSETEDCKYFEFNECPLYNDPQKSICDCLWKDPRDWLSCWDYPDSMRNQQHGIFCGQSSDADPETGNRNNVSYPFHSADPNTTSWWTDFFQMPGAERGALPSGYKTVFDRVGVLSAAAVASVPLYNYIENLDRNKHFLGLYFAFENDGMFQGYSGCSFEYREMSKWQATVENKAEEFGGKELCPVGKWGYDPRCRGWYAQGRDRGLSDGGVLITAPYLFATGIEVATSATTAIFDPVTGEHVGQTLLDFTPERIFDHLVNTHAEISVVVSPTADATGGDTVIGPGYDAGADPAPVGDVVLPLDSKDLSNRLEFDEKIVTPMKAGGSGYEVFTRTEAEGGHRAYVMAFAPIKLRSLKISRPDDFSTGVANYTEFIFSIGVARREDILRRPFEKIQGDVKEEHQSLIYLYCGLIVALSIFVLVFTSMISVFIAKPMILLLRIVQNVNAGRIEDDIPPMKGGSAEVNQVYNSFAKLFKVVRVSNSAFFSGNLKWAFHFINNALKLFRKVSDRKATGIACNNLGNTMLAIYCDRATPNSCCEIDGVCFNGRAKDLFDEAIEIGKREFQTSNTDDEKADFAQQLANRHFNRGVFLLLTKDDPCAAADARESGYKDLMEAQQLDSDVDDYWLQKKLMFKNSAEYFERIVRRLLGLIVLSSDMRVRDIWDCRELLKDLDSLLFAAWDQPHAPLFRDLDRTGRLQQLEDVAIRMETSLKNHVEAARLAMRMLIEDEYILESAFLSAATALLTYTTLGQAVQWSTETIVSSKADLRKILKSCKGSSLDAGKCLVVCLELSEAWKDSPLLSKISDSCLLLYDEYFNDNDYISAVSSREDVDESFRLELNRKGVQNRTQFEAVTRYTGGATLQATIPIAVQMLADKPECRDNDTYVIAVIDSASWGSFSPEAIRHQVDRMNRERDTVINIIIIGLDIQSQEVRESCVELCMVSKASIFLEATADTIDALFDQVSLIITKQSACGTMLGGITMEKF